MSDLKPPPVALVTGGARRIGAAITGQLHQAGYRVLIHYRHSCGDAQALCDQLNGCRADSCQLLQADLTRLEQIDTLAQQAQAVWGRLDLLVNNASNFYPTPFGEVTQQQWDDLLGANLRGPFFLCQALTDALRATEGSIVNLVDTHSQHGLADYPAYSIAKAGVAMMTQVLARELAPVVRVNGVSPGPILPPEGAAQRDLDSQARVRDATLLKRYGHPDDIAATVLFLAQQAYTTGQIIAVDGGKTLYP